MELLNLTGETVTQLETRGFSFRGRISIFLNEYLQPDGEAPLDLNWSNLRKILDILYLDSTPRNLRVIFLHVFFPCLGTFLNPLTSTLRWPVVYPFVSYLKTSNCLMDIPVS